MASNQIKIRKAAKLVLPLCGWSQDYRYDPSSDIQVLRHYRFDVNRSAVEFLERFGGLKIDKYTQWPFRTIHRKSECITIGGLRESDVLAHIQLESKKFSHTAGSALCLVGDYLSSGDLYCAENGAVYGAWEDYLFLLGASAEEGVENICRKRSKKKLRVDL